MAKWIPLYGEPAKAEIADIRSELVSRLGAGQALRDLAESITMSSTATLAGVMHSLTH